MPVSSVQSEVSQQTEVSLLPCDLVMKGGITSGIVYPPAILRLKGIYKFRNIGGTSAGAIAASGIAAAEFNRNNGGSDDGFDYLDKHVQQWLGADSNLRNLFQASPATRPLMDFAFSFLRTPTAAPRSAAQQKPSPFQPIFKLLRAWLFNYLPISLGSVVGAIIGIILFFSSL